MSGWTALTPREQQMVRVMVAGHHCSNKEIAEQLGISHQTIKNMMTTVLRALGLTSRLELGLYALRHWPWLFSRPTRHDEPILYG